MQRYFGEIINNKIVLNDDEKHHLLHVMRADVGDKIEVVSNEKLFVGEIKCCSPLNIEIIKECVCDVELKSDVTLFFAISKGDKNDFIVQKATELGVKNIVFINTKRCISKFDGKEDKKLARFCKIAKEASEQSHRLVIPNVTGPIDLKNINKEMLSEYNFVAYEKESCNIENMILMNSKPKSVSIFIGPEGGFEENEIKFLNSLGIKSISLGKRILRCETAAVSALSILGYLLEKNYE